MNQFVLGFIVGCFIGPFGFASIVYLIDLIQHRVHEKKTQESRFTLGKDIHDETVPTLINFDD